MIHRLLSLGVFGCVVLLGTALSCDLVEDEGRVVNDSPIAERTYFVDDAPEEQARLQALAQSEEERLAALAQSEEERLAALAEAEEARLAAQAQSEEERLAAMAEAEEERLAALAQSEEERLAAMAEAEEARLAALAEAQVEEAPIPAPPNPDPATIASPIQATPTPMPRCLQLLSSDLVHDEHYALTQDYEPVPEHLLDTLGHSEYRAHSDRISGEIVNQCELPLRDAEILVALFDSEEKQVGTASDEIRELQPNTTWRFQAKYYDLNVGSHEVSEISYHLDTEVTVADPSCLEWTYSALEHGEHYALDARGHSLDESLTVNLDHAEYYPHVDHIVGEIVNGCETEIESVGIYVPLFDTQGRQVGTGTDWIQDLQADTIWRFRAQVFSMDVDHHVVSKVVYDLDRDHRYISPEPSCLRLISSTNFSYVSPWGTTYYVAGDIVNECAVEIERVDVIVALFDDSGRQIGSASDILRDLQLGATWAFHAEPSGGLVADHHLVSEIRYDLGVDETP